jgi:hypothetical protein
MLERGDLLLVPFPFTDSSAAKRRPVLALTALDGAILCLTKAIFQVLKNIFLPLFNR